MQLNLQLKDWEMGDSIHWVFKIYIQSSLANHEPKKPSPTCTHVNLNSQCNPIGVGDCQATKKNTVDPWSIS